MHDLLPADGTTLFLGDVGRQFIEHPGLHGIFRGIGVLWVADAQSEFIDALLRVGIVFPLTLRSLITTKVNPWTREKFHRFIQNILEESHRPRVNTKKIRCNIGTHHRDFARRS